ncbi:MAG: triose-phosphate isomerase family protein [Microbacteriaceae bacterium]
MSSAALTGKRTVGVGLKMYLDHPSTLRWLEGVRDEIGEHPAVVSGAVGVFVLPGFTSLVEAATIFEGSPILFGAQDLSWADAGPYTGEVSGIDLAQIGCMFVEVGHAERKRHFAETGEIFSRKLDAAYRNGLVPVLCVGEEERGSAQKAGEIVVGQLDEALALSTQTDAVGPLVLAYEPVWAIGAPEPAPAEFIREVADTLRHAIEKRPALAGSRLIYGGSASSGLLPSLGDAVDGLFLGRSSHDISVLRDVIDEAAS